MITVANDGTGMFDTIQEAIDSIQMLPEKIFVKSGIYHERVEVSMPYLTIEGENAADTIIEYDNCANMMIGDEKRGTFRSYTMLVTGDHFNLSNITVSNTAGPGSKAGQAIALYVESDMANITGCRILGHQDTLFTGPLPKEEAKAGGFKGPTEHNMRRLCRQFYTDCYIEGDVDFIFGSAAAYFDNCEIHSLNRNMEPNGYVTAPSTYEGQKYGYVFNSCHFTSNCPDNSVYLGRPWRIYAQTVLINCTLDGHIKKEGFFDWNKPESHDTVFFAEYKSRGAGSDNTQRASYVRSLSDEEALIYTRCAFSNNSL